MANREFVDGWHVFDPYHKWLGIPPEDQPPSHYRLLGLRAFEADPDVIQAAADQRMAHLRNYQTGQHADLSQRLLNEVAAARVCLLNPVKRAAYDSQLRERMEASQPAAYDVQAATPSGGLLAGMLDELSDFPAPPIRPRPFLLSGYRRRRLLRRFAAGLAAVVLLMLLCSYWPGNNVSPPPPDAVATSTNRPAVENVKKAKRSDGAPPAKKAKQTAVRTEEKGSTEAAAPAPSSAAKLPGATATAPKKTSQAVLSLTPDNPPPLANPTAMTSAMSERNADAGHASEGRWPGKSLSEKPPRERVAVPGTAALDDAMKLACDLYKDEFAKAKTAREKQAFARKLFDQAMAASNADAGTFVLFQLARDIAVQAADAGTAFGAVDALAERYQIDAPAMKAEVLAAFAKKGADAAGAPGDGGAGRTAHGRGSGGR